MKRGGKAQDGKIKLAYAALATLQKETKLPSRSAISRLTGISRETLNSSLPEWVEFDKARKGDVTAPLMEAKAEESTSERWQREVQALLARINKAEDGLSRLQKISDSVFQQLVNQVQQFFVMAKSTPKQLEEEARMRKDYESILQRLRLAEATVQKLAAEKALPNNVRPLGHKEIVDVISMESRKLDLSESVIFEQYVEAMNKLDDFFHETRAIMPSAVYVMCGLPASGKSRWIAAHRPPFGGTIIYIDGPAPTKSIRTMIERRVRKLSGTCEVICCRIRADLEECLKANRDAERDKAGLAMTDSVIRRIADSFEEVTLDEKFDLIIPV